MEPYPLQIAAQGYKGDDLCGSSAGRRAAPSSPHAFSNTDQNLRAERRRSGSSTSDQTAAERARKVPEQIKAKERAAGVP